MNRKEALEKKARQEFGELVRKQEEEAWSQVQSLLLEMEEQEKDYFNEHGYFNTLFMKVFPTKKFLPGVVSYLERKIKAAGYVPKINDNMISIYWED